MKRVEVLHEYRPGEYCRDVQCPRYDGVNFADECDECRAYLYYEWLRSHGYKLLIVSDLKGGDTMEATMETPAQSLNVTIDNLSNKLEKAKEMLGEMLGVHEGMAIAKCDESDGRLGVLVFSLATCEEYTDFILAQLECLTNQVG